MGEVCNEVPASVTRIIDEEQCSNVPSRKCLPTFKEEREEVLEQVPRQTYETKCKTEYIQECSQAPDQDYRAAPAPVPETAYASRPAPAYESSPTQNSYIPPVFDSRIENLLD